MTSLYTIKYILGSKGSKRSAWLFTSLHIFIKPKLLSEDGKISTKSSLFGKSLKSMFNSAVFYLISTCITNTVFWELGIYFTYHWVLLKDSLNPGLIEPFVNWIQKSIPLKRKLNWARNEKMRHCPVSVMH